jgi:hypothetical protein
LYADSDGAYDIGYGAYAHYSTIDWTNTIIDYVNPEKSEIVVVGGSPSFKPENYLTTNATTYYPQIMSSYLKITAEQIDAINVGGEYLISKFFNKEEGERITWKNA